METTSKCPSCGEWLAAPESRCPKCGPPAEAVAVLEPAPAPLDGPTPAKVEEPAGEGSLNTSCPICKNLVSARADQPFACPSCQSKLKCLFAAPLRVVPRKTLSELCTFHPEVHAVSRCRTCRKAICDTCAFRARLAVYCPDCATAPDEGGLKSSTNKGITSLFCGIVGFLSLGLMIGVSVSGGGKGAQLLAYIPIILGLAGVTTGFMSRDPVRGRSLIGLVGLIVNFLLLGIFALLIIAGLSGGG